MPARHWKYLVTATNVAALPAYYVVMTDDLDEVTPGYLSLCGGLGDAEWPDRRC